MNRRPLVMKTAFSIIGLVVLGLVGVARAESRVETDLSGQGWKLWYDQAAMWTNDALYLPPANVSQMAVHPPTGGWMALASKTVKDVEVPGTLEEYCQTKPGPAGDLTGVSWWFRAVHIPEANSPRKLRLRFDSARYRSEVFINQKLAGYDLVGNTPFEVDISDFAHPGETVQLAVRVTDPGGNFDWKDWMTIDWGTNKVPGSHGFSGLTGRVKLIVCDPVYVDDIYVQNTPAITEVTPQITIINRHDEAVVRNVQVRVVARTNPAVEVFRQEITKFVLQSGTNVLPLKIAVPQAQLWDIENPNLYVCQVSLFDGGQESDRDQKVFGFRWFDVSGVGTNAMFRLNGKRIVLRSAIDWGFWPINGIFPSDEMAAKQIRVAKAMGLNMLNCHRCIGHPNLFEQADELGLLYYEEPGNYRSSDSPDNSFAHALMREKLMRMVKRDRSHPSVIIYCLINEETDPVPAGVLALQTRDLRDAHELDPSRLLLRNSGLWPSANEVAEPQKNHYRPYDSTLHKNGWYDTHRAGGPSWWSSSLYRNPQEYYGKTDNVREITFWGEEGATSTPPRLDEIENDLGHAPNLGWDGGVYREWYRTFTRLLDGKQLRTAFPTVDSLTKCMAAISLDTHGRKIEAARAANLVDGFVINGWEAQIIDNPSGIVDCFRNPKADPAILAYYNQPLYVAVKLRGQIIQTPGEVVADFYAINEKNLKGPHTLRIALKDPAGRENFHRELSVMIEGGDVYGQLIAEAVRIPVRGQGGMYRLEASLIDAAGREAATGHDQILAVDLASSPVTGQGCVWEFNDKLKKVLQNDKGLRVPDFNSRLPKLDWMVVARPPRGSDFSLIPPGQFLDAAGQPTLVATYFRGQNFADKVIQRPNENINLLVAVGDTPEPEVKVTENFGIRWEGRLLPSRSGVHEFEIQASSLASLSLDGEQIIKMNRGGTGRGKTSLEAGKPVRVCVEFRQLKGASNCKLLWSTPESEPVDPQQIFERVNRDGTTLIVLDYATLWMELIAKNTAAKYSGSFVVGPSWRGGVLFVKDHPLFKDLPVNEGMGWAYQSVVQKVRERFGLLLEGDELAAGAYHACPMNVGTAVGIIPCGKGKIIVNTLDISSNLNSSDGPASVGRKLFYNFIEYAGRH